ncbi:MAG: hypothetical protein LBI02_03770 [Opitutaceae bacterium]|jgi:hypothetical protein|nr:hypothetical protein [Opitutaceae bacterium]
MPLDDILHQRERAAADQAAAEDRWLRERAGIDPAERRRAWHKWLLAELGRTFRWPDDRLKRGRLQGQCAHSLTLMARQLYGRGWLLDGAALARHVRACLAPIAQAQREGRAEAFWPYFQKAISTYVGAHAEEIQQEARRSGAVPGITSVGALLSALRGKLAPRPRSLVEDLVEAPQKPRPSRP